VVVFALVALVGGKVEEVKRNPALWWAAFVPSGGAEAPEHLAYEGLSTAGLSGLPCSASPSSHRPDMEFAGFSIRR
jgi:hypothetical protein